MRSLSCVSKIEISINNGFYGVVEEIVVVGSILVGDGLDDLLTQDTTNYGCHRAELTEEETQRRVRNLLNRNLKGSECRVTKVTQFS